MNELPIPPLWPDDEVEVVETISVSDIVWLYKHYFDVDVSDEFSHPFIRLVKNSRREFYFFDPPVAGSDSFYQQLYCKIGYPSEKAEYEWASTFIEPSKTILDVGCGYGDFSRYVEHGQYHGIEPNPESVAKGREMGVDVKQIFVEDMAADGCSFDVVTVFQVLEHVSNPRDFFRACSECVVAGGLLIASVPNVHGYLGTRENTPLNMPPHHVTRWSLRSLMALCAEHGLAVIDYHEEKLQSMADYSESLFKSGLNRLLRRQPRSIRRGKLDRLASSVLYTMGRLLPRPPALIAPNGHSITVVCKKSSSAS